MTNPKRHIGQDGMVVWKLPNGDLHREDGPAVEYPDGRRTWFQRNERHRVDGPAVIKCDGTQEWWENDLRHREDGPAVEYPDGREEWYLNGVLHRTDGPAVKEHGGLKRWHVNGYFVDVEDGDVVQKEREQMEQMEFCLRVDELDVVDLFTEQEDIRYFLFLKDACSLKMLQHSNVHVAAVSAWHLPIDDDYLAVVLPRPDVRGIMQHRNDVPEHVRTLLEVAS